MLTEDLLCLIVEQKTLTSVHLERSVLVDIYRPGNFDNLNTSLLLINDGQNLNEMGFDSILDSLYGLNQLEQLMCVGIHADMDRKNEYGTARFLDYEGRGPIGRRSGSCF